jgi:hypothetical protein
MTRSVLRRRTVVVALLVAAVPFVALLGVGPAVAEELPSGSETTMVLLEHDHAPDQPTLDENVTVTATVRSIANGHRDYFVTDLRLYEEPDAEGDVLASNTSDELLAPGGRVEKSVETDFETAGLQNLSIRVRLRTTDGRPITIVRPVTVRVRDSHPEVALQASRVDRAGETNLDLRVANGLNESIRSLSLRLGGGDVSLADPERVRSALAAGETATFRFNGSEATVGSTGMTLRLAYTAPDGERRVVRRTLPVSLQPVGNPANITLTNLELTPTASGVEIRGSASNEGGKPADSVKVTVLDGDRVGPAPGGSSFFVGSVPASDFSAFDVTASVRGNETVSIPLRVSFVDDGVEVSRTATLSYTPPSRPAEPSNSGGGLPLIPIAAVGVLLLAVGGWWRLR